MGIDQRRMGRRSSVDPRPGLLGVEVESDRDDRETLVFELFMQCLPPGQAGAAASPRRPGDEQHLSAVE